MSILLAPLILLFQELEPVHTNHLAQETSPYLLQHAHNPVDWYPWGPVALERAKAEKKPIFLSIGYSACHWCHVMERESFENEDIAEILNEHFISIKVDREERPDLDDFYMAAVQRMTGGGGWPMTVFLTPELKPFYGGTYFPPTAKWGKPGFIDLLRSITDAWMNRQDEIRASADGLTQALEMKFPPQPEVVLPTPKAFGELEKIWLGEFEKVFDSDWGGFGKAPKFPHAEDLRWLLSAAERLGPKQKTAHDMVLFTLRKMASGGMYDQIGGGFARYSVDAKWLIPHFEKMLYDQGTLLPAYLEAWRQTGDGFFRGVVEETVDYLLRDMRHDGGAFFSSTDADSEGEEGKFFAWTPAQLIEILGDKDGKKAADLFGVTKAGNFEHGKSALTRSGDFSSDDAKRIRPLLYQARLKRVPPGTDDKILTAWNGLALDAIAQAGFTLGRADYIAAAESGGKFLLANLRKNGQWLRAWRNGKAQHSALLEDHAYLGRAFLSLFQATGKAVWLKEAEAIAETMVARFGDLETGVFWDSDGLDPTLIQRRKSPWDGAIPSPNSVALEVLLKLHAFTQKEVWEKRWRAGFAAVLPMCQRNPRGFSGTMRPLAWAVDEPAVAVVVGSRGADAWRLAFSRPGQGKVLPVFLAQADVNSKLGLFASRPEIDGKATLYLCRGKTCEAPNNDPQGWHR
jgi:uncharacterized protein YyaL (SSP411 family)